MRKASRAMEQNAAHSDANSAELYRQKWDHMFQERAHFEWHCDFDKVSSLLEPYFKKALSKTSSHTPEDENTIVDVGCGSSSLCIDIFKHYAAPNSSARFQKLILTDVSPYILDLMKEKYKDDAIIKDNTAFHIVDCRYLNSIGIEDGSVSVVLEKGTVDAMDGEEDKVAILRECMRVMRSDGVVVSISFPAVGRLQMLQEEVKRWSEREGGAGGAGDQLQLHMHVVGSGDPARGGTVVFVAVIGRERVMKEAGYEPSELTKTVLERVTKTGSIIQEEEAVEEEVDVFGDV